jgi:CheY-like chemotaxis protein
MRYMTELFDGVLDVAKLDNDAMPVAMLQMPVVSFCERLVTEHRRVAEDLGLRLEICIPAGDELSVMTDPKLLERIVRNFISNAIRYTRTGGIRLRISVRDSACRIAVTDTGPGIPASERKAIFEEFSRGGRVELTTQGSGLGLAIVRRLAARIGGRIAVRSHLGIGSMFSIDIPLSTAPRSAAAKAISHEAEFVDRLLANLSAGAPPHTLLLCIGCAPDVGDAIAVLAAELEIEIFTAHTMEEALLRLAREGRVPDLVLLDMKPGGESPWLSIERVNDEFNTEMPMILCADEAAWIDRPGIGNRVRCLAKPYSITALRDAITQSLSLLT